ncbi:hypothetical protein C8F04DRAFT_1276688 [Mycena alexandri]|uniref:Uncharacterized protein n=1 Tax=Mycena alexandri TaxID=1745969 RepID=A0AAD6WSA2_9AGAR|nr:hypothetical protein C8F04DRAFT_1276688 [Mycena alexandri]
MALLRMTRSIVSGSAALLMVSNLDFEPGDLDIYSPLSQEETVLSIASLRLGFDLKGTRIPRCYPSNAAISTVHRLEKGQKSMNIIIVDSEDPVAAIFHFHLTVVMNYLTAFGLYCAYPTLTLSDYGVANLSAVLRDTAVRTIAEVASKNIERGG